jgi:predicted ArsR family transcriptional regulator
VQPAPAAALEEGNRFAAAVAAVTSAFGDPTRREIFLDVRAQPGSTASEVATRFSLHPNVARHHLDRLVAGGYVRVETGRDGHEHGAGRPAKRYLPVGDDPTIELLTRRDDLLVRLLQEAVALLGKAGLAAGTAAQPCPPWLVFLVSARFILRVILR